MKNYVTLCFFCLAFLLMGTKCKNKKATQTIKGRVMLNCTTPYANGLLRLKGNMGYAPGFCKDESGNREFYTDANGYFEFKYIFNGNKGTLHAPNAALNLIPIDKELVDIGELTLNSKVNFYIKLNVNNAHTAYDTLQIPDYHNMYSLYGIKIAGPFASGVVDTIVGWSYIHYPIKYNQTPKLFFNYIISGVNKSFYFETPLCNNGFSEAVITID